MCWCGFTWRTARVSLATLPSPHATMGGRSTVGRGVREKSSSSGMVLTSSRKLDTASRHFSRLLHRRDWKGKRHMSAYMELFLKGLLLPVYQVCATENNFTAEQLTMWLWIHTCHCTYSLGDTKCFSSLANTADVKCFRIDLRKETVVDSTRTRTIL